MTALRIGTGADLLSATRVMDRLFDQVFGYGNPGPAGDNGAPGHWLPVDIMESDEAYVLRASVAGIPAENVDVTFEDGLLSIRARAVPLPTEGRWLRLERPWGDWLRKLELPKEVDAAGIQAHFDNGLLTVTVPKATRAQPVRIPVGAAGAADSKRLKG